MDGQVWTWVGVDGRVWMQCCVFYKFMGVTVSVSAGTGGNCVCLCMYEKLKKTNTKNCDRYMCVTGEITCVDMLVWVVVGRYGGCSRYPNLGKDKGGCNWVAGGTNKYGKTDTKKNRKYIEGRTQRGTKKKGGDNKHGPLQEIHCKKQTANSSRGRIKLLLVQTPATTQTH